MTYGQAGKGDRPRSVDREKWDRNYDRVFGYKSEFFESIRKLEEILDETNDTGPCDHPGCKSHVTHPCEGCGRQWGKE